MMIMKTSPRPRAARTTFALISVLAALGVAGCGASNGNPDSRLTADQAKAPISGAPPQLAAIRSQANQLLDGGTDAFDARLQQLRGTPVVVNKWASWCGPCRVEFPLLRKVAAHDKDVVFIGVNSNDNDGNARKFLAEEPPEEWLTKAWDGEAAGGGGPSPLSWNMIRIGG